MWQENKQLFFDKVLKAICFFLCVCQFKLFNLFKTVYFMYFLHKLEIVYDWRFSLALFIKHAHRQFKENMAIKSFILNFESNHVGWISMAHKSCRTTLSLRVHNSSKNLLSMRSWEVNMKTKLTLFTLIHIFGPIVDDSSVHVTPKTLNICLCNALSKCTNFSWRHLVYVGYWLILTIAK